MIVKPSTLSPPQPACVVQIDALSFGYRDRPIVRGLNLRAEAGKVVAIMGGSGVGKTTLLRLIGGQYRSQSGGVTVLGENVGALSREGLYRLRRRMGVLFQHGALFSDLTVFENVAFPLREHTRLPEESIRDLVLMKLQAVGLRGAAALRTHEISGGMARRVALARAVVLDPELILYDEPFAGLDPISLGITANLIRRFNNALGATSILVTHDVAETFAIADYVYLLSPGPDGAFVVAHGTPENLNASKDPFVFQFLNGQPEGPAQFHYPAPSIAEDFGLSPESKALPSGEGR